MSNAFREIAKQKPMPVLEVDPKKCAAHGCPGRATMSDGGSKFTCMAHYSAVSDRWPAITHSLNEYRWLIEFIDEVKTMDRKLEDWRGFAVQFWANQDEACQPDPLENFTPYENRMRGELLYRGGLAKRPAVRLPKPPAPRRFGNAADSLGAHA